MAKIIASTNHKRQPLLYRQFKTYNRWADLLPRLWWQIIWEPRDLWIGVYWDRPDIQWRHCLDVYICVLPCLPLKLSMRWSGLVWPEADA
jgi:hypothetical protein